MKQIKIIIPLIALCLFLGTGRAKSPMDGHRSVQHCPKHSQLVKVAGAGVNHRKKYGVEFSGNREDLPAGEEIL